MSRNASGMLRIALLVASAFFIENFDATAIATIATSIGHELGVPPAAVGIAFSAYLLAVAALIPVGGWAASRWGARRVFVCAIVASAAGSALCAVSTGLAELTAARVLQGVGGSMMVPVGRLIVLSLTAKGDLVRIIAILTWPGLIAPVLAPALGGAIAEFVGWRWVFLVNLPLCAALAAGARLIIPADLHKRDRRLDTGSLVLVSSAMFAAVAGLQLMSDRSTFISGAATLAVGITLGAAAVRRLLRISEPLLQLRVFRQPTFRVTNSSGFWFRAAISAAPFVVPLLLQIGMGLSPARSGLLLLWLFLGNFAVKPLTTPLLRNAGFVSLLVLAGVGVAASFVVASTVTVATPLPVVAGLLFFSGAFRSIGLTAYNTIQFADVPLDEMGAANTLSSMLTQLGSGTGVALSAAVVAFVGASAARDDAASSMLGVQIALWLMALLSAAATIGALRLPKGAASRLRARP